MLTGERHLFPKHFFDFLGQQRIPHCAGGRHYRIRSRSDIVAIIFWRAHATDTNDGVT